MTCRCLARFAKPLVPNNWLWLLNGESGKREAPLWLFFCNPAYLYRIVQVVVLFYHHNYQSNLSLQIKFLTQKTVKRKNTVKRPRTKSLSGTLKKIVVSQNSLYLRAFKRDMERKMKNWLFYRAQVQCMPRQRHSISIWGDRIRWARKKTFSISLDISISLKAECHRSNSAGGYWMNRTAQGESKSKIETYISLEG